MRKWAEKRIPTSYYQSICYLGHICQWHSFDWFLLEIVTRTRLLEKIFGIVNSPLFYSAQFSSQWNQFCIARCVRYLLTLSSFNLVSFCWNYCSLPKNVQDKCEELKCHNVIWKIKRETLPRIPLSPHKIGSYLLFVVSCLVRNRNFGVIENALIEIGWEWVGIVSRHLWKRANKFIEMDTKSSIHPGGIMKMDIFFVFQTAVLRLFCVASQMTRQSLMRPLRLSGVFLLKGGFAEWANFALPCRNACKHEFHVMSTKSLLNSQLKLNYLKRNRNANKQFWPPSHEMRTNLTSDWGLWHFANAFKSIPISFRSNALIAFPRWKCQRPTKKTHHFFFFFRWQIWRGVFVHASVCL